MYACSHVCIDLSAALENITAHCVTISQQPHEKAGVFPEVGAPVDVVDV